MIGSYPIMRFDLGAGKYRKDSQQSLLLNQSTGTSGPCPNVRGGEGATLIKEGPTLNR